MSIVSDSVSMLFKSSLYIACLLGNVVFYSLIF